MSEEPPPSAIDGTGDGGPPTPRKGGGGFAVNVLALGGGATIAQLVRVASSPVISRLFTPEAFGLAGVFTSFVQIVALLGCLSYELAIVLPKRDEDAVNLFWLCVALLGGTVALVAVVLALVGDPFLELVRTPELKGLKFLLPAGVLLAGLLLPLRLWNVRQRHFKRLATVRMALSGGTVGSTLLLGFLGYQAGMHLISARMLGMFAGAAILAWFWLRHDSRYAVHRFRVGRIRQLAAEYKKFPLVTCGTAAMSQASRQMPVLLIAGFFGKDIVGLFAMAMGLLNLPVSLISGGISQVFYERAAAAKASGQPLGPLVERLSNRLVTLGLLPMLIVAVVGPELFATVLGQRWGEAGLFATLLTLWLFFMFVSSPLTRLYFVLQRQGLQFLLNALILALRIGGLLIGGLVLRSAFWAVLLFSAAGAVASLTMVLVLARLTKARLGYMLRHALVQAAHAGVYVALLAALKWWWPRHPVVLVVAAALSLVPYGLVAVRTDPELRALFGQLVAKLRRVFRAGAEDSQAPPQG